MKLYKLTDKDGRTRGATQWGEGVTHVATGNVNQGLCSSGFIHAYEHPFVAVFMNPIHGNFKNPQLWEAEGEASARDGALKCGVRSLTTVRRVDLPVITSDQRVRIAIYCALACRRSSEFKKWAVAWLDGSDRSKGAAAAAAAAAEDFDLLNILKAVVEAGK